MWKTPWGLILNNVCHVSVDIMELFWKKFGVFITEFSGFFGSQTWRRKRTDFSCTNNLSGKLNICYLTESLLIENIRSSSKVNDFIWMLFWFLWKCCLLNARLNAMLGYQYSYTNACVAMVEKHILKIWDDSVVNKRLSLRANIFISFHLRFSWIVNVALW